MGFDDSVVGHPTIGRSVASACRRCKF